MAENYLEKHVSRRGLLRMMGGGAGIALFGGGAVSLLTGCGTSSGGSSGGSGSGGSGQLAVGLSDEPDSLDPATMILLPSYQVTSSIYDQLLWKVAGQSPDSFLPGLATSYSVSPDGKTYTFKLRKGVTFHDGTPFDASAVKATFDRIVAPATKSVSAKAVLGPYRSSTVVDDSTVQVSFTAANGGFLDNVASPLLAIVSPTAASKQGALFGRHPVGTGPFKFSSWIAGLSILVVRNEDYAWGPDTAGLRGPAKLSQVTFRIVTSSPSQANALQTGALQVAQQLDIPDAVRLVKAGFRQHVVGASGVSFGYGLNVQKAPTNDLRVRQAIQYATDPQAIISTVFSDVYQSANTVLTSQTFGHSKTVTYSYQPDRAAALLDQAGWTMGSGGVRRKNGQPLHLSWLLESGGFGFEEAAELMSAQLQKAGITSQLTQLATAEYVSGIGAGNMNVSGLYDYAADPYVLNTLFSCAQVGGGANDAHFCSPQVDTQIAAANGTVEASARAAAYGAVQDELMRQAIFVPIYNTADIFVTATSVSGITYTPLAVPLLTGATT
jgi:peptide/nickel transport system substrate-binding protein